MSYQIILADPPWRYRDSANAGKRGAVYKYRTLTVPEICALDVPGIAAPNCLLALWWVPAMPIEALEVVRSWGFKLKGTSINPFQTFRTL